MYNFKEANLPSNFCEEYLKIAEENIRQCSSFTLIGMPAASTTLFLKYLATKTFAHFVYTDTYALSALTKKEFFLMLLKELGCKEMKGTEQEIIEACKDELKNLAMKHERVVIIFNRFGQMEDEFDANFLGTLRTLTNIAANKIVLLFSMTRPYIDIAPEAIQGGNLHIFSKFVYFPPLPEKDLLLLLKLHSPELVSNTAYFRKVVSLSGGHLQLLQLLLKTERTENPILDPYIKLLLQEIYNNFTFRQKKALEKIAFKKSVKDLDSYLVKIGVINGSSILFSPLLEEYIKQTVRLKLPVKEAKLFSLLKKNIGKVVSKNKIFDYVWKDEPDSASDWALDALIYRLRRNVGFQKSGYVIESNKKVGYTLIRIA